MVRFIKPLSTGFSLFFLIALCSESTFALARVSLTSIAQDPQQTQTDDKAEKRKARRARRAEASKDGKPDQPAQPKDGGSKFTGETVEIVGDRQQKNGDLLVCDGYVIATLDDMRLQADHVTYNDATADMVAEGNVIFDQGPDQRVTARRAEINWTSRKGTFWESTGFTDRTETGEYIFFVAERVEKTGPLTYELYNAEVTACEDVIPKWRFNAKRAELKMGDRVTLHNSVFHVKTLPVFVLPYTWIPATKKERKSGILLPTTGTSNQKGRTLKLAYYQTLGDSADITFRGDIYTQRGLGMGAEFRARTDEKSYLRLGVFTVKDRLWGQPGPDQGGTAFVGDAVQYLPHGWLAVGSVSLVSSLDFRQVFSDDISQVIDPRRQSTVYANNNTGNFSFNFLMSNETTTVFNAASDPAAVPGGGDSVDIRVRQLPEIDANVFPRRIIDKLPIYFSLESSVGALKRKETVEGTVTLDTGGAVQRFDFQPTITVPLATVAGIAVTPSLSFRETFYTASINPSVPQFNPDTFTVNPTDPRLDPTSPQFNPQVTVYNPSVLDPIAPRSISRHYAELAVDVRPPSLEKTFTNDDGSTRFKHLIEPYFTYRLIKGIGEEFNEIIRFDERDAVANTNEIEYALVNRFYNTKYASEFTRKRGKKFRGQPSQMNPVTPKREDDGSKKTKDSKTGKKEKATVEQTAAASDKPDQEQQAVQAEPQRDAPAKAQSAAPPSATKDEAKTDSTPAQEKKPKLETGTPAELNRPGFGDRDNQTGKSRSAKQADVDDAGNEDSPAQAYEFLTVKIAQKYFFDRNFGGALIEGQRNQFYPIDTLSGYTFGGRVRSFSPVNVAIRYRPLSVVYADLRMDVSAGDGVRDLTVSAGVRKGKVSAAGSYNLSREIQIQPNSFEPGTFPGDQISTTVQYGDELHGFYGGTRIGYDFTDRFISEGDISKGRLRNSRSYLGWGWDCCGVQFNYNTFKAGLRNESAFSFTFTLAGLGSYGTDQFSQLGGGQGGRKRGKRNRNSSGDDDLP
ncbi:MAG TPA: putative LPS assembly protein LptD [Blastocatellia bacterium]|nr:putative LPS assembly protein LptD [Blastocatellia bacterium]